MDHDQRFKTLLREFFQEFFELFFPDWAARFDFGNVEWLEQEIYSDPPKGQRNFVDLIAKLPVHQPVVFSGSEPVESSIALVHVEIESGETSLAIRRRLFRYHAQMEDKLKLPVLPIVLFLKVGKDGLGWDCFEKYFWEHCLLRFDFPYIGLPALDAEEYLHKSNWLGIALTALMKITPERRLSLGTEAWARLVQYPENTFKRFLLCECVNAYIPVDETQRQQFEHLPVNHPDPGVKTMTITMFEKARQEGRREGRQEGRQELLLALLQNKFGVVSEEVKHRVAELTEEQIIKTVLAVSSAESLQELGLE